MTSLVLKLWDETKMFRVVEKLKEDKPAEVEQFQKNVQPFVKEVLTNFDEYSLYCGKLLLKAMNRHIAPSNNRLTCVVS
jgi:hypothetical protein